MKQKLVVLATLLPGDLIAVEGLLLVRPFLETRYRGRRTCEHPDRPSAYADSRAFPSIAAIINISLVVSTFERGEGIERVRETYELSPLLFADVEVLVRLLPLGEGITIVDVSYLSPLRPVKGRKTGNKPSSLTAWTSSPATGRSLSVWSKHNDAVNTQGTGNGCTEHGCLV